ncbi:DMT family transporter [Pollutimonas bauzanensis]|uniref:EamA domain-containing membrane protein RarD n=1 Tax=Pollutimonas bauzanensis TaxID=658167 RepID=A0A1M5Z9U6_9BURK|nr:DMT family transporter [Pollutimonas bauzanensis]SHI20979.1 EamA domain-containing membrane protein RarD [Pollutimonas bauzanensis]
MENQVRRGSLEMAGAMLISGTIGWFVLVSGQPVLDVVFWRCAFGAVTLLAICGLMGFLRPGLLSWPVFGWAVVSGVAIVGNWVLLFAAYSRASIGIATAVYNTQPFMLVGLGALFLRERITLDKMMWLSLAFIGMLAITQSHGASGYGGHAYLAGIALSLAAAFLYAIAALLVKRLTGTPPHLIALIQVCAGVLMLAPFAQVTALAHQPPAAWMTLLAMGVVHTGLMYVLLYGAIQKLPTALTGALSFIYPIVAIIVDWVAFGHRLEWLQWFGVAAILFAAAAMRQGWAPGRRRALP